MRGLIIKDFLNLKKQMLPIAFFFVLYLFISITVGNSNFFSGVIMMFCAMLPITALSYDDRAGWSKYALTMPVSRQMLVISKYLMALILVAVGSVLILFFNGIIGGYSFGEGLLSTVTMMCIGILILSIALPVNYKFGIEKGRYVLIGVCIMPAAAVSMLSVGVSNVESEKVFGVMDLVIEVFTSSWFIFAELLFIAIIFFASMMLSVRIILKKQF